MRTAIKRQEKELLNYFAGKVLETSLSRISEKLGERDERIFWQVVAIGKSDTAAPQRLQVGGVWLDTFECAGQLIESILRHSMNGKKLTQDVKAARAFLDGLREKAAL